MFTFPPGSAIFFYAGLAAAAGPIIIHLLNRRRFRVINWAAMDFLLEALRRNRRVLQLRDLLLLALRTACLVLFGLALAQPLFSGAGADHLRPNQPLHAILVVDNSLSMGYEKLDGTLLGEAKARAKEFVDDLPEGSRVSVVPLCGSAAAFSRDAFRTKQDARDAIERIETVDRTGTAAQAADLALEAMREAPELQKRVVLLGDQQASAWPAGGLGESFKNLAEMQVVSVAASAAENTWIDSFVLQDGVADTQSQAVLSAVVRHEGPSSRPRVPVTLAVDGTEVESVTVDLEPGQSREVVFKHRFEATVEPGRPTFVPVCVSIPSDRLPEDDARVLAAPIVAALPVVFVDQYGSDEDPPRMRYGETRHLRRLLSPVTARGEAAKQLVEVRHKRIDELSRELLETARLVVVAGVESPGGEGTDSDGPDEQSPARLLREFVEQGGQLMIAAGGDFDPSSWNREAWLDGAGVLPAPLKSEPIGKTPLEAEDEVKPFFLSFASMSHDLFQLADTGIEELEELYAMPVFFKAVEVDASATHANTLVAAETRRIEVARKTMLELDGQLRTFADQEAQGTLSPGDRAKRQALEELRSTLEPQWLSWRGTDGAASDLANQNVSPRELAERGRPRVLAAFDNRAPFLVERSIGRGHVVFVSTAAYSDWNNLPKTNAVLLFDRLLRGMLERTLPRRNLTTGETLSLGVPDRTTAYSLTRPDGVVESLSVDALGADRYGLGVRNVARRGVYKLTAAKPSESADAAASDVKLWETNLAYNGPAVESEPLCLDAAGFRQRVGDAPLRWVGRGEPINLAGGAVSGQNLWKWLLVAVLVCLVVEMLVLARPLLVPERSA